MMCKDNEKQREKRARERMKQRKFRWREGKSEVLNVRKKECVKRVKEKLRKKEEY